MRPTAPAGRQPFFFVYDNLALYSACLTPLLLFLLACFSLSVSQIHSAQSSIRDRDCTACFSLSLSLSLTHTFSCSYTYTHTLCTRCVSLTRCASLAQAISASLHRDFHIGDINIYIR